MRSRATNILQVIILITGLVYAIIGCAFYISPINVLNFFVIEKQEVNDTDAGSNEAIEKAITQNKAEGGFSENWLNQMVNDQILGPFYFLFRIFAALLLTSGISMIMPLFDPLRYRGLVYYNGVIFPLLAILLYVVNIISINFRNRDGALISVLMSSKSHLLVMVVVVTFSALLLMNIFGLVMTKKQSDLGKE